MAPSKGPRSGRRASSNGPSEPTTKRLDAYIRVSDVRGREGPSFIAPENQLQKARDWARFKGHEIIAIQEELDVSGRKASRPKLDEVMRRIREGETDGVVVWKCSRFGRNLLNSLTLIREIDQHGAMFASATEEFDTSTRMGRLVMHIMLALAEDESDAIGEGWYDAKHKAAERGVVSYQPPYGYKKRKHDGRLEPDRDTAPIVKTIFKRRARGETLPRIREWLESTGIPTPRADRPESWTVTRVGDILKVDTYLGHIRLGDEVFEGTHDALVDPATWEAAQAARATRSIGLGGPVTVLLRGLVRCAGCRYLATNRPGKRGRDYVCSHMAHGARCPEGISMPEGSGPIAKGLNDYVVDRTLAALEPIQAKPLQVGPDELAEIERPVSLANEKLSVYMDDTEVREAVGRNEDLRQIKAIRVEIDAAERARDEELSRLGRGDVPPRHLADDWPDMSLAEKNHLLHQLIQAVFVRRSPTHPERVAEARRLHAEGLTYKEIGERLAPERGAPAKDIAWHWVNKGTDGARHAGASDDRVRIVWADDPPVDIPWKGRRDYVAKPFDFPKEPALKGAELSDLAARAYEAWLGERFPEVVWVARSVPQGNGGGGAP